MRVLVTGAGGLVGGALCQQLVDAGDEVHGTVRSRPAPAGVNSYAVELSSLGSFGAMVDRVRPDVVVHTAYSMTDLGRDVVQASEQVAMACGSAGVRLIHMSTDAVFDGENAPYGEHDVPEPIHPYGRAKRDAELIVQASVPDAAVVRTALVAHLDDERPDAATQWILDAQRRGEPVTLFVDEVRSVVRLDDLVAVLVELVSIEPAYMVGVWHVGGPDRLSRWELGQIVAEHFDLDRSLLVAGEAASMGQPRPRDVSLRCDRLVQELSVRPGHVATVPRHGQATG